MKTHHSLICFIAFLLSQFMPIVAVADAKPFPGDMLGKLKLGMMENEIIKILGAPERKRQQEKHQPATGEWLTTWVYAAEGLVLDLSSYQKDAPKTIRSIVADMKCALATSKGIKIGSTLAEVEKAYGEFEHYIEEKAAGLSYHTASEVESISFDIKDGKVVRISMRPPDE